MKLTLKVLSFSLMLGLISINLYAADWPALIGQHEYFVGRALNTPAGDFPYALRLSEDKKTLSTSKSERGYQSFTLTDDGLSFELKLGAEGYLFAGILAESDRDPESTKWVFSGEVYGKPTTMIFFLEGDKLKVITSRNEQEHARIELQAKSS